MAAHSGQAFIEPALFPPESAQVPAQIKVEPEDWQVTEEFDAAFTQTGEHGYFLIEKRCLSTAPVAAWLAKQFDVPERDVGFAGMKDKHALTRQWFSVRLPGPEEALDIPRLERTEGDERIKVLASHRHQRKLRRGEHQANRFRIVLRSVDQPVDTDVLTRSFESGFPNYFGPQRFGRHNLGDALHWLNRRRDRRVARRVSRQQKGWHLSVLRSWVFNELLAARVADGSWQTCLDGDAVGQGGVLGEAIPTGPLWGRGRERRTGEALRRQQRSFEQIKTPDESQSLGAVCEALEYAGVDRGERGLAVKPWDVGCEQDLSARTVTATFCLPVGAYATVMLGQWFALRDMSLEPSQ